MSEDKSTSGLSYRDAGVDIDAGNELVRRIGPLAAATNRPGVLDAIGGFGGLFGLSEAGYTDPVLVSGTDGVGTKLKLAFATEIHDTVGVDLVAMCVNDILCVGAEALFFLDYFATGALSPAVGEAVVRGVAEGCKQAGCALLGGETAELPGMYAPGEYDLAGFAVGAVERSRIVDSKRVMVGDVLIGLPSTGLHSNGYSLARKALLEVAGHKLEDVIPGWEETLGEALLTPTRIYCRPVLKVLAELDGAVHGIAHITGGGLLENVPRALPNGLAATVNYGTWPEPAVFELIRRVGVTESEMRRTFNLGIGMVLVVAPDAVDTVATLLASVGQDSHRIGVVGSAA